MASDVDSPTEHLYNEYRMSRQNNSQSTKQNRTNNNRAQNRLDPLTLDNTTEHLYNEYRISRHNSQSTARNGTEQTNRTKQTNGTKQTNRTKQTYRTNNNREQNRTDPLTLDNTTEHLYNEYRISRHNSQSTARNGIEQTNRTKQTNRTNNTEQNRTDPLTLDNTTEHLYNEYRISRHNSQSTARNGIEQTNRTNNNREQNRTGNDDDD